MTIQQPLHANRTDELLNLLAVDRRRELLTYLRDSSSGVATVETLADEIDKEDHGGGGESTALVLVHSDLPQLDAAGLVEFDERSTTVRYQSNSSVEQLLDCIEAL